MTIIERIKCIIPSFPLIGIGIHLNYYAETETSD